MSSPTAIITGAGSGVGRALSIVLAKAGWRSVLIARTASKLEETRQIAAHQTSGRAVCELLPGDVGDPVTSQRAVQLAMEKFGGIDAIANVAGCAAMVPIEQITPQLWRNVVDTNLSSNIYMAAAVWPQFQKQRSGIVANVSSFAAVDPFPGFSMYAPAKAGVNMFTHCAAQEGKAYNIKAVCFMLGCVETPMLRAIADESVIPKDKALNPLDVATLISDCLTGRRNFTSGETIPVPSP